MTRRGRGWFGESRRHAQAARRGRVPTNLALLEVRKERQVQVRKLLKENAADLKVGTKIMMDAKEMMLTGHYRLGKKQLLGAEDIWAVKGQLLLRQARELDSPELEKAGKAHVQAAHGMTKQILAEVARERRK